MHCEKAEMLLAQMAFGELDAASPEGSEISAHLAVCRACAELLNDMRVAANLARDGVMAGPAPTLSDERRAVLMGKAAEISASRRLPAARRRAGAFGGRGRVIGLTSAAAAAVLLAGVVFQQTGMREACAPGACVDEVVIQSGCARQAPAGELEFDPEKQRDLFKFGEDSGFVFGHGAAKTPPPDTAPATSLRIIAGSKAPGNGFDYETLKEIVEGARLRVQSEDLRRRSKSEEAGRSDYGRRPSTPSQDEDKRKIFDVRDLSREGPKFPSPSSILSLPAGETKAPHPAEKSAAEPSVTRQRGENDDHFETDNGMDRNSARGAEDAITDIPFAGAGKVGVIGEGGGEAMAGRPESPRRSDGEKKEERETGNERGLPNVMDLPVVGKLFSRDNDGAKSEAIKDWVALAEAARPASPRELAAQELLKNTKPGDYAVAGKTDSARPPFIVLNGERGQFVEQQHQLPGQQGQQQQAQSQKELEEFSQPVNSPVVPPSPPPSPDPETSTPSAAVFKVVPVNPFVMTKQDRLSTFALDVDTASYSIARRYIRSGYLPPVGSVRMEEFVNAFDYNYPRRTSGTFTAISEAAPAPFGEGLVLLKVGVRGRVIGREGRKPAHLVFVVDASGSMAQPDRMPLVKYALKELTGQLSSADRVSLVAYGTKPRLLLEGAPASDKQAVAAAIDGVQCEGSTNLAEGLSLGYRLAAQGFVPGGINRVILCSDGAANIGTTAGEDILDQVKAFRDKGITCSCVGFGAGTYNDVLLEKLADSGDGNYAFVDSKGEARRIFVEEMSATLQTIAKDTKIQVDFDPARVRRYRLIGYENRDIADEKFRDDTVDAGEVGSGQSATALYEVELQGAPEADLGTVYVRYREVDSGRVEEISHRLGAASVRARTPESDPRFFLAACAAEFAELLRASEHAAGGSFDALREQLERAAAQPALRDNPRVQELLGLVRLAKGLPRAE